MSTLYEKQQTEISDGLYEIYIETGGEVLFRFIQIGEWLEEQGYFHINTKLFGEALAILASKELGLNYKYQEKIILYKTSNFTEYRKFISILSPEEYYDYYKKWDSEYSFRKASRFDTIFSKNPIVLKENEILLYSGDSGYSSPQSPFISSAFPPNLQLVWFYYGDGFDHKFHLNNFSYFQDVKYENANYDLIQRFVIAIMNYKLQNRKPNLTEEDMEIILRDFGFKREDESQKFTRVLSNIRANAINALAMNNQVGKVLKKTKTY
jgi:hypothetical protein